MNRRRYRSMLPASLAVVLALSACGTSEAGPSWPTADVELVTDDLGVTHVRAGSDEDAFYGAGYAMARDRLFQMELSRRRALGTSAAIFGARALRDDIGARTFDFGGLGARDLARTQRERPDDARLVDAWIAGVNARIEEIRDGASPRPYGLRSGELDFVPEPWRAEHAFAVGKLLAFGLSSSLESELLATALTRVAPSFAGRVPLSLPAYDTFTMLAGRQPDRRSAPPPAAVDASSSSRLLLLPAGVAWAPPLLLTERGLSNNWAVAGALTDSKRPLVAGDPHQPTTSPQRLWPFHMDSKTRGGTLDVVGFSFVGTPAVQLGHNHSTAWTATTNNADVMDLWDVRIDTERDVLVLGDGDHPLHHRAETIRVRRDGAPAFEGEETTVTVDEVEGLGVLLPDDVLPLPRAFLADGNGILFNWTGFRPSLELSAYVAIDRAEDVAGFERAADLLDVGAANYVAADASHVSYHVHARIPDRGAPGTHPMPWRIMPGSDAATLWTRGDLGADRLPHLRDPARGFVSTANNDPWGFTVDGNVDNDPFYYGAFYSTGFRAFRIDQRLGELASRRQPITHADMVALQDDTSSPLADDVVPLLSMAMTTLASDPALAAYRGNDDVRALAASLIAWDRRMLRDRGEPLAFHGLLWFATRRLFSKDLPDALFEAIATRSPPFLLGQLRNVLANRFPAADSFVPPGGRAALLLAALTDTASWLRARYGSVDPARFRWGDANVCVFANAFGGALTPPPVGVDGGSDTIKVNEAPFFGGQAPRDRFESKDVSLYRMVIGFQPDGRAQATVSFARGTREDPAGPHFQDQEARWVAGEQSALPFARADVDARASERLVLRGRSPGGQP